MLLLLVLLLVVVIVAVMLLLLVVVKLLVIVVLVLVSFTDARRLRATKLRRALEDWLPNPLSRKHSLQPLDSLDSSIEAMKAMNIEYTTCLSNIPLHLYMYLCLLTAVVTAPGLTGISKSSGRMSHVMSRLFLASAT